MYSHTRILVTRRDGRDIRFAGHFAYDPLRRINRGVYLAIESDRCYLLYYSDFVYTIARPAIPQSSITILYRSAGTLSIVFYLVILEK